MTRTKVGIDECVEDSLSKGDVLYADDLEGCTVVAAVWPKESETFPAFFAHFGGSTIMDEENGQKLVDKFADVLLIATSDGVVAPEGAWLIYAKDRNGEERYKEGNDLIRKMLTDANVTAEEWSYPPPQGNMTQTVELRVGEDEPLIMP
ncbi:MAG: hypothetical protein M1839_003173 [Geoglossum umbratile]|nr:MAG: hypothetical protein M1839_003173 [Geoglossum umbratile]